MSRIIRIIRDKDGKLFVKKPVEAVSRYATQLRHVSGVTCMCEECKRISSFTAAAPPAIEDVPLSDEDKAILRDIAEMKSDLTPADPVAKYLDFDGVKEVGKEVHDDFDAFLGQSLVAGKKLTELFFHYVDYVTLRTWLAENHPEDRRDSPAAALQAHILSKVNQNAITFAYHTCAKILGCGTHRASFAFGKHVIKIDMRCATGSTRHHREINIYNAITKANKDAPVCRMYFYPVYASIYSDLSYFEVVIVERVHPCYNVIPTKEYTRLRQSILACGEEFRNVVLKIGRRDDGEYVIYGFK